MPDFTRRSILGMIGASSLAPMLPSGGVVMASPTPLPSVSKALWAGIHAKAGSSAAFVTSARNLGLSNTAIKGVGARTLGVHLAVGQGVQAASSCARPTSPKRSILKIDENVQQRIKDFLFEPDDNEELLDIDAPSRNAEEPHDHEA